MAYTELEEALPNQEGAADVPTDQPRLPPPQEEVADTPKNRSGPAPPPVDWQTHLPSRMRWKLLKFMRRRQL